MPDLIDSILDSLSLTSLDLLDKIDVESERISKHFCDALENSLDEMESAYLGRCASELNHKTELLISSTRKYKSVLDKFTAQFGRYQFGDVHNDNPKKIKVYAQQIENLERELNLLTQKSGRDGAEDVFLKIEEMNREIEELQAKNKELTEKLKGYEGFPANIREAEYCLSDLKERIQKKEAEWESTLYGKSALV
ncbi:UNVERIFIED_CONTAM: hypothetical protein PYX00_007189 [Menopon gallinae]|uniref:Uncharacterized protein n=1 Tax=Menopon gallinae TaxID=328185 RepID=A0AAW2HI50_9NEOP